MVKPGITGYLVPPKNVNELTDKMFMVLSNPELLQAMSNNINSLISSGECSWRQITEKMTKLYTSVLK